MWPKIHSNRDPRDTLLKELGKEFGVYLKLGSQWGGRLLRSHPRKSFYAMVVLLVISVVLSFTLFRNPEKMAIATQKEVSPISDGFGRIIQTTGKIRETMALKTLVDSLSRMKHLSSRDSSRLISALDRLQALTPH